MELRKRGARRAPPPAIRPSAAYQEKEQYVSREQMEALQALYTSSPAIAAVREVLRGELFRGGLCLKRGGKDVVLTAEFERHLRGPWLDCASKILDSILKWGLVVVVLDEDVPPPSLTA